MQRLNHGYIYIYIYRLIFDIIFLSSPLPLSLDSTKKIRMEREKRGGREWKRDEKETDSERGGRLDRDAKRDREKNIYIEVVVVVVLLVDFPFSYSI